MSHFYCLPAVLAAVVFFSASSISAIADDSWIVIEGNSGPGVGKRIVLIAGDEEYRSEEALPQLAKILAARHGFHCTVLFSIDEKSGLIDPDNRENIPGLEALEKADLMVIATRFRALPDEQMKWVDDYLKSGRPLIGMRTATHAFNFPKESDWHHYSNGYAGDQTAWHGGFGRLVLGEQWVSHHGRHGQQATGGIIEPESQDHPILRGIADRDVFAPTDVYGVRLPEPDEWTVLMRGAVLDGMHPESPPVEGDVNQPMMPIAWIKPYGVPGGKQGQVFTTTMGASVDLSSEGVRRLLVNACYWSVGLADEITSSSDVRLVGEYEPTMYGFGKFRQGVRPADLK